MTRPQRARQGDESAFADIVAKHRRELFALCYRILGSAADAEDALQEALLAAWRGLPRFEQRSSVRTWLYTITTRCALRTAEQRGPRIMSWDLGPSRSPDDDLGAPVEDHVFVEPWLGGPADAYERREAVELAMVAAFQHLPAKQRAVLVLRDVLAFSAAETAALLGTSVASVTSALQRARTTLADHRESGRLPSAVSDLDASTPDDHRLVDAFVAAWERADVPALVDLLTDDAVFTMPPLPAWYAGRTDIAGFLSSRVFATEWRLQRMHANGRPALACYQGPEFRLGAVNVLHVRDGSVCWIAGFVDPAVVAGSGLPHTLPNHSSDRSLGVDR